MERLGEANVRVYGLDDRIPCVTHRVDGGSIVRLFGKVRVDVLHTPCHTRGHVVYHATRDMPHANERGDGSSAPADNDGSWAVEAEEVTRCARAGGVLFSGDTLFVAGCGRFFEGDAGDMERALRELRLRLPPSALVFPGHEYTLRNLEFALSVEPGNPGAAAKSAWAHARRKEHLPTVPSLLSEEAAYNPFLRLSSPELRASLGVLPRATDTEVMRALRAAKDVF